MRQKPKESQTPQELKAFNEMKEFETSVSNNIRMAREKASLTQEEMSEKLGINRTSYAAYERGKTSIDIEFLYKVSKICKCDIGHLLGEYKEKHWSAKDISKETGLSKTAVDMLMELKTFNRKKHIDTRTDNITTLSALNFFIENGLLDIMSNIRMEKIVDIRVIKDSPYNDFPTPLKKRLKSLFDESYDDEEYICSIADYLIETGDLMDYTNIKPKGNTPATPLTAIENATTQQILNNLADFISQERKEKVAAYLTRTGIDDKYKDKISTAATTLYNGSNEYLKFSNEKKYRLYDMETAFMDIVKEYIYK